MTQRLALFLFLGIGTNHSVEAMDRFAEIPRDVSDASGETVSAHTQDALLGRDDAVSEAALNALILRAVAFDGDDAEGELHSAEPFSAIKPHLGDNYCQDFAESGNKSARELPASAANDLLKKVDLRMRDSDFVNDSGTAEKSDNHCTSCFKNDERFCDVSSSEDADIEFAASDDKEALAVIDQSFEYQEYIDGLLLEAACEGDHETVANSLDAGAYKEARTAEGLTAVQLAALRGHLEVVVCLIKRDVSLSATINECDNALHHAVWNGHRQIAALLIANGVSVMSLGKRGCSPAHYAAYRKQIQLLEFLHTEGADLTARNKKGNSPLHCAAWSGSLECTEYLLANCPFVLDLNGRKWSPIHCAARKGHKAIVERLIMELMNRDQSLKTIPEFHTVMHCAQESGNAELVDYLRRLGF